MKFLWRISNRCNLEGIGGERAHGRWHTAARGKRIVYLSEHPALALVEVLANLKGNPKLFPDAYQLIKANVPDSISVTAIEQEALSGDWRADLAQTRRVGDEWLAASRSALLEVPSVPSPESFNFLLNPLHPDAHLLGIEWCKWITYDQRLFHL
ncbi:MAG TPA: RES family NAD+ phosphorylase [Bryobacteraceae bacterium]|jgi:RES domain-containing protein|nr:RES family NAD+ phosphorylase [Bryobacteraceae bacterium]